MNSLTRCAVRSLGAALSLLLPTECVACGAPDHSLCSECTRGIGVPTTPVRLLAEPPGAPPLPVWSGVVYDGRMSAALAAFKESGRTDAARPLARVLERALVGARRELAPVLPRGAPLELTLAPSARGAVRRRGYDPVGMLATRARGSLRVVPTLCVALPTADQAGLGLAARRANLSGHLALRSRFRGGLHGRHFLLVDDVITTGSTLLECRRALQDAGASVWGAATLAFTPKHRGASLVRLRDEREGPSG